MKQRNHRWYSKTYDFNEKLNKKFTTTGIVLFLLAFSLIFFGLNTDVSMLFVIFSLILSLLVTDAISLFRKIPNFKIVRYLPQFVTVGQKFKYKVLIKDDEAKCKNREFFYKEIPANPKPDYKTFASTPEPGEEKRNRYDRRMGYYRWKWLIDRNVGGLWEEFNIEGEKIAKNSSFEITFSPQRRGKFTLTGVYLFKKGVFGLLKKGRAIEALGSFTVFPQILAVEKVELMSGGTNSNSDRVIETEETGVGYELKSLRDYLPGDSPRSIHWKSSAKTGDLKVKEFHKEVDAGIVMFVDNFFDESYLESFEDLLTVACSLLNYFYEIGKMPQFLVVGEEVLDMSNQSKETLTKALSMLAVVTNVKSQNFKGSIQNLIKLSNQCCSIFFLTPTYNHLRLQAIELLLKNKIDTGVIYTGEKEGTSDLATTEKYISKEELNSKRLTL